MSNKLKAFIPVILLVIALALVLVIDHSRSHSAVGAVSQNTPSNCGGSVTCFTDVAVSNLYAISDSWLGGSTDATSIQNVVVSGSCNSASTTLFAVANPFNASSTVVLQKIIGTAQATTSNLLVGTSTKSVGLVASDVTASLVNSTAGLATSSSFYLSSGVTAGSLGFISAGTGSLRQIEVGPSDFIVGYSTSTGAGGYVPGQSCTYTLDFTR